ncbi:unnamed protein product [Oppiella nova]|uniref:SGNH hydrolase-type esterase domain-containing protein n=1 Tax=Oppiella nova TaxID=334625 RepID=A0A7R9LSJ7_9ACAR|nr:unnamed protein product [Oppiella nova]CAG2166218.1 unnamed protein product [Oppiella nova]
MLSLIVASVCVLGISAQHHPWDPQPGDGGAVWLKKHEAMVNQTRDHKAEVEIVFVGDSITELWAGNGKAVWAKYYAPRHAFNYGIGGDRTEAVIYRIQHQEFDGLDPKVTVVMIGTNNAAPNTAEDIAHGVNETVTELLSKMPNTKVILLGILPRDSLHDKVKQVNEMIKKLNNDKNVFFLDMWSAYETDGVMHTELYDNPKDRLHLSTKGYEVWQQTMEPLLKKLDPTL